MSKGNKMGFRWKEEHDIIIRKYFNVIDKKELEKMFDGKEFRLIHKRAFDLYNKGNFMKRPYSEWEDNYLMEYYGTKLMKDLVKRLCRTEASIRNRMVYLTGTDDVCAVSGNYSSSDIATIMGLDKSSVNLYIKKGELLAMKLGNKNVVNYELFWNWLENNLDKVRVDNIDRYDILESPDWYKEFVIGNKKQSKKYQQWSNYDKNLLWTTYLNNGMIIDVANQLGRNIQSVYNKLHQLKKENYSIGGIN
jgi:hypothetical protein